MNDLAPALTLALSLAIGLLVGTERGWQSRTEAPGTRVAGVRAFGLPGLLGGVVGLVGIDSHPAIAGVVLAVPILINTLVKVGIAIVTAGWRKDGRAAIPLLGSSAVMPLAYLVTR